MSIRLAEAIRFGMIGDARTGMSNALLWEAIMTTSHVIDFAQTGRLMTYEEGLAFIERMRRQLDRFEVAVPGANGRRMNPETEAKIRCLCDELEAEFRSDLRYT
jgi:hypothetical protein